MLGQRLSLGPLDLLELINLRARAVVDSADSLGEQGLKVGIAHGRCRKRVRGARTGQTAKLAISTSGGKLAGNWIKVYDLHGGAVCRRRLPRPKRGEILWPLG